MRKFCTAYQDDGDYGVKFIAEQRKWIAEFEANPDGNNSCDASDFSGLLGEALTEIERLNSQLAERDALIKRLIEAGSVCVDEYIQLYGCNTDESNAWDALVAEYRAMKGE